MKKSRYTEEQVAYALRLAESGTPVAADDQMRSAMLGRSTLQVEVTNIWPHGFWLLIGEQEPFVSFKAFPWFEDASIRATGSGPR
jgi:hypothetical protein